MISNATLSPCGRFRYRLTRSWDGTLPRLLFIMLNPSTADAEVNDPTIRKCIGFAQRNGFGSIVVANLYAYRATDPDDLKAAGYPVGENCDEFIDFSLWDADAVVCAWGTQARAKACRKRVAEVMALIKRSRPSLQPQALRITDDGTPCHPLMLPYSCALQPFEHEATA